MCTSLRYCRETGGMHTVAVVQGCAHSGWQWSAPTHSDKIAATQIKEPPLQSH